MIIRKRNKPLPLQKLDAIIPRLAPTFPGLPAIKKDAAIRQRGYSGELKVDYHLESLASRYTILQDVCLSINGKATQMDSLIAGQHAIYIVDTKNYRDTITFDTILKQLTRSDGQVESGFEYPITQVENQKFHLQNWLDQRSLANTPIYYFIAISEPSTIIKVTGDAETIGKVVAHGARIPTMIMEKEQQLAQAGAETLQDWKIGKMILGACIDYDRNILKEHGIQNKDLLPGVICPECGARGMKRVHSGWRCGKCDCYSRFAHKEALRTYLLLIKPYITNSECMKWLCFNGKNIATKLMKEYPLHYDKKHRRWKL